MNGWVDWVSTRTLSLLAAMCTNCMSMDRYYASPCLSFLICEMGSVLQGD